MKFYWQSIEGYNHWGIQVKIQSQKNPQLKNLISSNVVREKPTGPPSIGRSWISAINYSKIMKNEKDESLINGCKSPLSVTLRVSLNSKKI